VWTSRIRGVCHRRRAGEAAELRGVGADGAAPSTVAEGDYDRKRHWLLDVTATAWSSDAYLRRGYGLHAARAGPLLPVAEAELVAMAGGWPHAPRGVVLPDCGTATRWLPPYGTVVPVCEKDRFPRTDPAIIVAIIDPNDRILLADKRLATGRHSVLAGFVEAGESLEQAVHRECSRSQAPGGRRDVLGSQPCRSAVDHAGLPRPSRDDRDHVDGEEIVSVAGTPGTSSSPRDGRTVTSREASIAFRLIRNWLERSQPDLGQASYRRERAPRRAVRGR